MKYLIVTIRRGGPFQDAMIYPTVYDAEDVDRNKRGPIVYESALSLGEDTEECMIYINDALADQYEFDPDMRIVTETEADEWLMANRKLAGTPTERVTDLNRIEAIKLKMDAGVNLSEEDLLALDPDEPMAGINRMSKTAKAIFGG